MERIAAGLEWCWRRKVDLSGSNLLSEPHDGDGGHTRYLTHSVFGQRGVSLFRPDECGVDGALRTGLGNFVATAKFGIRIIVGAAKFRDRLSAAESKRLYVQSG